MRDEKTTQRVRDRYRPLSAPAPDRPATFREVFAVREFRPLFGTFLLSTAGDELARVALTVLVYQRTSSPLLSALTFAISYLPWLLGGPVLAALADRLPRHRVLIAADTGRAALLGLMAVPGMPLPALLALLFLVALCTPPFESARSALLADILEGDRYAVAISLTNVSLQLAQVVGFLVAGMLVAVLAPTGALLIDGATFAITALWMWRGLHPRPAPLTEAGQTRRSLLQDTVEGLRFIARTPRLLAIVSVLWIATLFTYASEGIAAPLVRELGQGTTALGVLLAANPLGVTIGGLVLARLVSPARRVRAVGPLVLLSLAAVLGAGLVASLAAPGVVTLSAVVALLFISGLGSSWLIPLNVSFVQAVPSAYRGRAFGVAVSGLFGVQGLGILAAGGLAEDLAPSVVVALSGGLGLVAAAPCLLAYRRTQPDRTDAGADRTEGHMAGDDDGAGPSTS